MSSDQPPWSSAFETATGSSAASAGDRIVRFAASVETELWVVVVVAMAADLALTVYGLERGLTEANPVAVYSMEVLGLAGLGVLKLLALGVGVVGWVLVPREYAAVVPLGLAVPTTLTVLVNTWTISVAL